MNTSYRLLRAVAAGLLVLASLGVAFYFGSAALAERFLARDWNFGDVGLTAYGPDISPPFFVQADSLVVSSPDFRAGIVRPSVRLVDWLRLNPSKAVLRLRADSVHVEWRGEGRTAKEAPEFPATLRFPLGASLEWRTLVLRLPDATAIAFDSASWRSLGSHAAEGAFTLGVAGAPRLRVEADARWSGPALRYRVTASRADEAEFSLTGIREKRNLLSGRDSVALFLADPARWHEAVPAGVLSDLRLEGKADWRKDSLRLTARFSTSPFPPFDSAAWTLAADLGAKGGRFALQGDGATQSLRARGRWARPGSRLFALPPAAQWTGDGSIEFRGGSWRIHVWDLPLGFEIPEARLDTGMAVSARVTTEGGSRILARWNGRRPGRVELSGDVSTSEAWALIWTEGNVSYRAARVKAVWEDSKLLATANIARPRAYGASADSLEAVNEVTSSGYFLKSARVHRDGEIFRGSGEVLWKDAAGRHAVSLAFNASHPVHGRAEVAMDFPENRPWSLLLVADSLYPARSPYDPARRFAALDPLLHGRFDWRPSRREAETAFGLRISGGDSALDIRAAANWKGDSLRITRLEAKAGASRLEGEATVPFDGRPLRLREAGVWMKGAWRLRADELNPRSMLARAGLPGQAFDGILRGEMAYADATGLSGTLRLDALRIPGTDVFAVNDAVFQGLGDTLSADAVLAARFPVPRHDTLRATLSEFRSPAPGFRAEARSSAGFTARFSGSIPGWQAMRGDLGVSGHFPLAEGHGAVEDFSFGGILHVPLKGDYFADARLEEGRLGFRHVSSRDTLRVSGTPKLARGALRVPDLVVGNGRGELAGSLEAGAGVSGVAAALRGDSVDVALPGGQRLRARGFEGALAWSADSGLRADATATSGFFALPPAPYRIETGFDRLRVEAVVPPTQAAVPPSLKLRGQFHDFYFQRRWGWRDVTGFFTGFNRGTTRVATTRRASRPWEVDVEVEATGPRNRIDTDVLRMTFIGDVRMTGTYPYTLVRGKISGLQGEVGQPRQAYVLRDFELKWDNVPLEDGTLNVEGEKRLRADCRPDTRQTCQIYVRLDGRLEEVGFTYDTDCGQNAGEPVPPSVLINSMAQGCYVSETPGSEGNYGSAAFAMLEPALNERLSQGFARGSGGFIKSTQVSGLGALLGSDSTGLEAVSLEVESRSIHRVGLKGRAGYRPETKLSNPMEYRLAAEYRPPVEKLASDSAWQARLKSRVTVEAAVETRPEGRDIEEERRVSQRAGLRYRYRFWTLW